MNDIRDLLKLPVAERLQIIGDLWDSIDANDHPPLTNAQMKEIDRRLAEHDADPSSARDWNTVRDEIRSRIK